MRTALTFGLCLIALTTAVAAPKSKPASKSTQQAAHAPERIVSPQETYRARLNDNLITIMAGSPSGTDLAIAHDIAEVIDDEDRFRIVPMVGKGATQSIKDVLYLRGVDMGITHANLLKYYARTGELGPNFIDQVVYVAKLFNEEIHFLVREDVTDIAALKGQPVNLGEAGSGSDVTGHLLLETLGIPVDERHYGDDDAIAKLKSGELAGVMMIGGKPLPAAKGLEDLKGVKLLSIPYGPSLEADYYPATLTHEDYPSLIGAGQTVDTVAVCAVLIAFNWEKDSERYKRVARFVDGFFGKFDAFLAEPRHPKWREVNFAATLEGWHRSPAAQAWIDRAKASTVVAARDTATETPSKKSFDAFLAQTAQAGDAPATDAERADLFRAFLAWRRSQPNAN
jgi:TRAP-type uncharacterized transport system substrate-binding protein